MEQFDEIDDDVSMITVPRGKSSSKKRKWREIETLKERYRLQRELESIDVTCTVRSSDLEV